MRVAIYEPTSTGHHFAYLAHLVPALVDLGCPPIIVTTPAARRSPEFALHLGSLPAGVEIDTSLDEIGGKRGLDAWRHELDGITAAVRRLEPDHLYVPYGEGVTRAAGLTGLFGRRRWAQDVVAEVLLVRGAFADPTHTGRDRLSKRIAPWLIRRGPWNRIHHINPDDHARLTGRHGRFATRCRLMPDPVGPPSGATKSEARRALGIPEHGRYVGCVGNLGWRKGSVLLGAAFSAASNRLGRDDRLLLAGACAPDMRAQLEHELATELRNGRVVRIDRLLTAEELNLSVAALDLVCTPYRNHPHSASVVILAAAAGRPVLSSETGWMGRTVDRFGLGATFPVNDQRRFADALVEALDASADHVPTEAARRFVRFHSVRNFVGHWTAHLRERLGLPEDGDRVDWTWVTNALAPSLRNNGSDAMRSSISASNRR